MSTLRCPTCGGLVTADAEWCGQCLTPLAPQAAPPPGRSEPLAPTEADGPAPSPPAAESRPSTSPVGQEEWSPIEMVGDRMVWTCPSCFTENGIEASECERCGTPFARLFRQPEARPTIPRQSAFGLSLVFPGLGHVAAGRVAEGLARAVIFAWLAASSVIIFVARSGRGLGPFAPLAALYVLVAAGLWLVTAVDAGRAAESEPPVMTSRTLLYGVGVLMMVTIVVLLLSALRLSR